MSEVPISLVIDICFLILVFQVSFHVKLQFLVTLLLLNQFYIYVHLKEATVSRKTSSVHRKDLLQILYQLLDIDSNSHTMDLDDFMERTLLKECWYTLG